MNIPSFIKNITLGLNDLENQLETTVPQEGTFSKITKQVPVEYDKTMLLINLSVGAWQKPDLNSETENWQKMRYLEMTVFSQDEGEGVQSSTWIYSGTNSEIVEFLQSKEKFLPHIQSIFEKSIEHLQRDFQIRLYTF